MLRMPTSSTRATPLRATSMSAPIGAARSSRAAVPLARSAAGVGSPRAKAAGRAACLLIGLSFTYQSHLVPGAFSHVAQGLAVIVAPLGAWRDAYVRRAVSIGTIFAFVGLLAIIPTFFAFGVSGRISLAIDILANVWLWLSTFALLRQASTSWLIYLQRLGWLVALGGLVQAAVHPIVIISDNSRFLGLPRPLFTFSEPTWLGVACALLIAVFLTVRSSNWLLIILLCVDLFVFTRSALLITLVAIYVALRQGKARADAFVLVLSVAVAATYFTVSALLAPLNVRYVGTSLQTRLGDITAVRLANGNSLLPFGGANLSIYDPTRSRTIPTTSNNVVFDLLWKFGLGGILLFVIWIVLLGVGFPRILGARASVSFRFPAGAALLVLPFIGEINNMFREPWVWCLMAVLLVALETRIREDPTNHGLGRGYMRTVA